MRQVRTAAVVVTLAIVAVAAGSGAASPVTAPGAPGKIVISSRGFGSGAELVNPDGSGRTGIQIPGGYNPRWSADGKWLAYSNFPEPWVIRVVRADGTGDREVLSSAAGAPATDPSYAWSPSGAEIAYPCATGLCAVSVADGRTRRVVDVPAPSRAAFPAWSPDGSWIAFGCPLIGALCMTRPDGSETTVFTSDSGPAISFPDWSPDGRRIVFNARSKIYAFDVDSGEVRQLVDMGGELNARARWSPDGSSIVVHQFPSIYVVRLDGTQPIKIGEGGQPDWGTSPAATVAEARFESRWVLSRQVGRLVLAGTASHPAVLTVTIRSGRKTYPVRSTSISAGAYTASVALPPDLLPGPYEAVVGGTSGSERLLVTTRPASLAPPSAGLVASSKMSASLGGRRLKARFTFSARPARGRRPTAVWLSPSGSVRFREQLPNARVVTSALVADIPLPRGRWRCRLDVGGTTLAIARARIG